MASIINEAHGKLQRVITNIHTSPVVTRVSTTPLVGKAWRALILVNRATSGKTHYIKSLDEVDPASKVPNTLNGSLVAERRHQRIQANNKDFGLVARPNRQFNNHIVIINPAWKFDSESEDRSNKWFVAIQGMPKEIDIEPESSWAVVKSNGRNNPLYFYTGSEDTISFDVSWYSDTIDRKDVISDCRLLESWSKGDGYNAAPPELLIQWGSSNLFRDDTFILWSAPYTLSNFQNSYYDRDTDTQVDLGLIPCAATQKLVFKRVTPHNLTHQEIREVV